MIVKKEIVYRDMETDELKTIPVGTKLIDRKDYGSATEYNFENGLSIDLDINDTEYFEK